MKLSLKPKSAKPSAPGVAPLPECATCRFFYKDLWCRRFPPLSGRFEKVVAREWCGEWQAK
jgi:hypothetical protein